MIVDGMTEADVTINGKALTFAESMTLRVALESFAASGVTTLDGLGADDVGRGIAAGYRDAVAGIRRALYSAPPSPTPSPSPSPHHVGLERDEEYDD